MTRAVEIPPDVPLLEDGARAGGWWRETGEAEGQLLCELCPRACKLKPGDRGFCFVRENRGGQMALTTYGRSTGFCIDPIEKKPLNHFYPGTSVLSFGTAGCNLGCRFCQNWDISKSREVERLSEQATPEMIAAAARDRGCRSVAFTYNDPVIWAEYAIDVAAACRQLGIKTVAVTAGYIMPQARAPFFHAMDAANVDLKAFSESFYHQLTASHLQPVKDTLIWLRRESDVWFEITNLLIPDANDGDDELKEMCEWIVAELGDDVPLHFTAFHPDFRMRDRPATPHETLLRAQEIARQRGVKFAYVGNVDDVRHQSTYCPQCGGMLIERNWYALGEYHLRQSASSGGRPGGVCGHCGAAVAGRFDDHPGDWGRRREPVAIRQFQAPLVPLGSGRQAEQQRKQPVASSSTPGPSSTAGQFAWTAPQQAAVRRAAREIIEAAVAGRQPQLADPGLAGAATKVVQGIFTTLKRKGVLRGCCGALGKPMALLDALRQAAAKTAVDDSRMPPVTGRELAWLDLDVSVLHGFAPLPGDPQQRLAAVEVGRHGLQVRRGERSGLLLPVVAVENDWDAETLLRQTCGKAGLPSNAWQDPATQLVSFEAAVCGGPLADETSSAGAAAAAPLLSPSEISMLRQHVRQNVVAHMTGATPSYYLPGCSDGNAQALSITARAAALVSPLHMMQMSMRPGLPLQATLHSLAQAAGQHLSRHNVAPDEVDVDVAVFTEVAMHGRLSDPDLRGLDPAAQAVMVSERGKVGWATDAAATPSGLLERAAAEARVKSPQQTQVFSLLSCCSADEARGSNTPAPLRMATPRPAAVAGSFYPADEAEMRRTIAKLIGEPVARQAADAVMLPHAGWRYSGHIAADVLKRVEIPRKVIVIGPKHTPLGVEWAVAPHDQWQLPGGQVAADPALAARLAEAIEGLELDAAAHGREHAVEVELPLLAAMRPDVQVVGVALAGHSWPQAQQFAASLAGVLRQLDEQPLLVISSDMNHFAPDEENRRLDQIALEAMETGDGQRLLAACAEHSISMCGVFPAAIVIETLRQLGRDVRPRRLGYATSADVSGDKSRVVGYAGAVI